MYTSIFSTEASSHSEFPSFIGFARPTPPSVLSLLSERRGQVTDSDV